MRTRWETVSAAQKASIADWDAAWHREHAENVRLRAALERLADQAWVVYNSYDNEERGAVMWQELVALDAARENALAALRFTGRAVVGINRHWEDTE